MAAPAAKSAHWSGTGKMQGGRWGVWFFLTACRLLGRRLTYVFAVPVAAVLTFVSPDVAATMDYHRRVFGPVPAWKRRWLVFRHFLSFGCALIDRTAILANHAHGLSFAFDGENHLREAVAQGRGVLLLTAHLGNWEAAGQLLSRLEVPVNVTGFDHEAAAVRELLSKSSKAHFRLLPLTGSPTDTLPLIAALRRGEVVAMLGDRHYGSPSAPIQFLGGPASFPVGAYVMAALAGAPLVHVFSLREPHGHYRFFGFPPQHPQLPAHDRRDAYLADCAARFARDLESVLRRDPLQWYNFFPFWEQPVRVPSRRKPAVKECPSS